MWGSNVRKTKTEAIKDYLATYTEILDELIEKRSDGSTNASDYEKLLSQHARYIGHGVTGKDLENVLSVASLWKNRADDNEDILSPRLLKELNTEE